MTVVIQEEKTGCGIASVANIVGRSYSSVKEKANSIGILADDEALFSDTAYVRTLLAQYGFEVSSIEEPFDDWAKLPDVALLALKHHNEGGRSFWHWVVFKRDVAGSRVLDSAAYLDNNIRTDFEEMKPKWFIEVGGI